MQVHIGGGTLGFIVMIKIELLRLNALTAIKLLPEKEKPMQINSKQRDIARWE